MLVLYVSWDFLDTTRETLVNMAVAASADTQVALHRDTVMFAISFNPKSVSGLYGMKICSTTSTQLRLSSGNPGRVSYCKPTDARLPEKYIMEGTGIHLTSEPSKINVIVNTIFLYIFITDAGSLFMNRVDNAHEILARHPLSTD